MVCGLRRFGIAVAALAGILAPSTGLAGPLDPTAFAPSGLGVFPSLAGTYTVNTTGTPTITTPDGAIITGVVFQDSPGHSVAVFDFNGLYVSASQTIVATGDLPVAFLSRGDVTIGGTINLNGSTGLSGAGGGSPANPGPGVGSSVFIQGSGSGFGGQGGASGVTASNSNPTLTIPAIPGGLTYGNLATSLQGGSSTRSGAGAGGGIEIGALGGFNVLAGGVIEANGASSPQYFGGGSGGGIFVHAGLVNIAGTISANGGNGGKTGAIPGPGGSSGGGGGGGGGGRILLESTAGFYGQGPIVTANGGNGLGRATYSGDANDGGMGTVDAIPLAVPEPGSFALLATGGAIALGLGRRRRRRRAPGS